MISDISHSTDWWPAQALLKHPIRTVSVCGRQLHPPFYAYVVNFPRLEIPLQGCYENQIEENGLTSTICVKPGAALFAPPNCWNLPTWKRDVELMSLLFGKKQLGISIVTARNGQSPELANKYAIPSPLTGAVPHILEAMLELCQGNTTHAPIADLVRALLSCVEILVHDVNALQPGGRAQSLLERACVYLQNNYQYDITRESVAQQFNVTPNHLSRLFQTHGSMTFSSYLTHVRIDRAKHLLRSYDLKLDEVAVRCGYRDTPYFCRVFKHLAKVTPAEYRTRMQSRPAGTVEQLNH